MKSSGRFRHWGLRWSWPRSWLSKDRCGVKRPFPPPVRWTDSAIRQLLTPAYNRLNMPLTSGTRLGPYEIQSSIGAGGMGEVYRSHDSRLDRAVAIKVLPASFFADRDRLQRFAQEARAAAALNHPNILSIFDIGDQQGSPYVVSELLEGETLRDALKIGAISSRKAVEYAVQIARGLAAAHE